MYILIMVDRLNNLQDTMYMDGIKVEFVPKGRQMLGLRYLHMRPNLIIDQIKDRTLKDKHGVDQFDKWWTECVVSQGAKIISKEDTK